jgi:coproporphyrinogen III oxidase
MNFSKDCVNNVVNAYCPIVKKHKDDAFTPEQKQWQQVGGTRMASSLT